MIFFFYRISIASHSYTTMFQINNFNTQLIQIDEKVLFYRTNGSIKGGRVVEIGLDYLTVSWLSPSGIKMLKMLPYNNCWRKRYYHQRIFCLSAFLISIIVLLFCMDVFHNYKEAMKVENACQEGFFVKCKKNMTLWKVSIFNLSC